MNPMDIALAECMTTLANVQARLISSILENEGLKIALADKKKENEELRGQMQSADSPPA